MKQFIFNIQSKGGVGKSMLTYLQALKEQENPRSAFVDLDSSSRTSIKQLAFLKKKERVFEINITDSLKKIEREKFFEVIEGLLEMEFEKYYIDFGSPESTQFPSLFNFDFTIDEFKEFEKETASEFIFNIVVAGGPSYLSCMEYAQKVIDSINGKFKVFLFINDYSFVDQVYLINEINNYINKEKKVCGKKHFGNISTNRDSGVKITQNVKDGKGLNEYKGFATKTIIKREIAKL